MNEPQLRRDALAILKAALEEVDPVRLVARSLADEPELERWVQGLVASPPAVAAGVGGHRPTGGRTVVVAVGKAALGMTRGALHVLGDALDEGLVLVPRSPETPPGTAPPRPSWLPPQLRLLAGGHPIPDEDGRRGAERVAELARSLGPRDRLLVLLSGGGSALLTLPRPGISLGALQEVTRLLLGAGVPIQELNQVRGGLEVLKAGGLLTMAGPARILALLVSDVVGNDPAVIASGPLSGEPATRRQIQILLRRAGVWERLPGEVRSFLQQEGTGDPGPDPSPLDEERPLAATDPVVRVVGAGRTALAAAQAKARALGYTASVVTDRLTGEARRAGAGLARMGRAVQDEVTNLRPPACLLAAGETTVQVRGPGKGGRNQEVALGAALGLDGREGILVASLGTDGVDGPTDAAGALADGSTVTRARAVGLEVADALERNDAYPLLDALGDLIRTGPTGTNVADLMLVLVAP